MRYGRTLCESDDPYVIRSEAISARARGIDCEVLPGISTYYRVVERLPDRTVKWDRGYLVWRKAFSERMQRMVGRLT